MHADANIDGKDEPKDCVVLWISFVIDERNCVDRAAFGVLSRLGLRQLNHETGRGLFRDNITGCTCLSYVRDRERD